MKKLKIVFPYQIKRKKYLRAHYARTKRALEALFPENPELSKEERREKHQTKQLKKQIRNSKKK